MFFPTEYWDSDGLCYTNKSNRFWRVDVNIQRMEKNHLLEDGETYGWRMIRCQVRLPEGLVVSQ